MALVLLEKAQNTQRPQVPWRTIRLKFINRCILYYSLQIALALLENGADPNATDKLHSTPLHRASSKGNCRLITLLLEHSASTNIQDIEGNTPL